MPIELIGTIAVAVVILAIAAGVTARVGRVRPLIIGLGLAAIPVGLYLTGLLRLLINGIMSLVDWFQRTVFTNAVAWGLGLLVGGIILTVVGLMLPRKPAREHAAQPAAGREAPQRNRTRQVPGATAAKPATGTAPSTPSPAPKPADKPAAVQKGTDPEDAEIEALLRKRGIM
ncbi:hypothetical protein H5392_10525 [Tessaracoccus sp. MC1865]|uniref:hypothetical protein n=1 Tax=Tessaracoccus sp. MC1865 TaxID=2760310 RepID=UPI001600D495|nr:hypothetical protein [Tessaracoccus sp. MC1865]MBB1484292.1 hypothetical protein [Tessaracoccus sp. MC1865]QTO38590.1 hypothetical protein J7D54_05790 [Tessaracoccus sp. MC1865]